MEQQRQKPLWTEEEKRKKQKEIMSIPDRQTRIRAIARNRELFANRKEG